MRTIDQERSEFDPKQLLLQALELRWESYRTELKNCRSEFTEESGHDLRVATRRILALYPVVELDLAATALKEDDARIQKTA